MKNSKAVETVRDLYLLGGDEALERYSRFLVTNKKNYLSAFVAYVSAHLDEEEKLDKETVYKKVFRSKTYDRRRLENLAHHSVKEAMNFIMTDTLFMREFLQQKMKADYYKMKQWKEAYIEVVTENLQNFQPAEEAEWHLAKAEFYNDLYFCFKRDGTSEEDYANFLATSRFHFSIHAAIIRLKADCETFTMKVWRGKLLEEGFEQSLNYFILSLSPKVKAVPIVDLLLKAVHLTAKPDVTKYFELKDGLELHFDELRDDRKFIIRCLTNAIQLVEFPEGRHEELIQLYMRGITHKLFVVNGWMNEFQFGNMVNLACQMGYYDFAQKVLDTHKTYISAEAYGKTERYFQAQLLFSKGKYEAVLEKLDFNKFKKFPYDLRRFVLQLKCLYEMDKTGADALLSISRKFWRSLNKKLKNTPTLYGDLPKRIKNFTTLLNEIAKPPFLIKYSKQELLEKLDGFNEQIVEESWLRLKISELKR